MDFHMPFNAPRFMTLRGFFTSLGGNFGCPQGQRPIFHDDFGPNRLIKVKPLLDDPMDTYPGGFES